jgi:hypothetical protein
MVIFPLEPFLEMVPLLLEEKNLSRASNSQSSIEDEDHLAQIQVTYFLRSVVFQIFRINVIGLSLSIKGVDLIFLIIVKTFLREVLMIT